MLKQPTTKSEWELCWNCQDLEHRLQDFIRWKYHWGHTQRSVRRLGFYKSNLAENTICHILPRQFHFLSSITWVAIWNYVLDTGIYCIICVLRIIFPVFSRPTTVILKRRYCIYCCVPGKWGLQQKPPRPPHPNAGPDTLAHKWTSPNRPLLGNCPTDYVSLSW